MKYTGNSPKKSVFYFSFSVSVELYETPPISDFLGIPYSVGHCSKSTCSFQSASSKQHLWSSLPACRVCSGCCPCFSYSVPRSGLRVLAGDRISSGARWDPAPVWLSLCCSKASLERLCAPQQCNFLQQRGLQQWVCIHKRCCSARMLLSPSGECFWSILVSTRRELQTLSVLQSCHPT